MAVAWQAIYRPAGIIETEGAAALGVRPTPIDETLIGQPGLIEGL
jgi:hypothetical protein